MTKLTEYLQNLMQIDSPSSFCRRAAEYLQTETTRLGFKSRLTNKGCLEVYAPGRSAAKKVAVAAHIDTLGMMIRSIMPTGGLRFTRIGGPLLNSLEGEYCRLYTRQGKVYTGTILSDSCSVHVYDDAATLERGEERMWIRLDERVKTKEDVLKLGIRPGDIVAFEPRTIITPTGFVKSRFLDDKASAACLMETLRLIAAGDFLPVNDTVFCFTVYEEVGHGCAAVCEGAEEILAVDMGCIGKDLTCSEYDVSICAKDSGGPYDYEMTSRLIAKAEKAGIAFAVDIYPRYGSDVGAYLHAGHDAKGALIGPGIHASHGVERTTVEALENTVKLIKSYLED